MLKLIKYVLSEADERYFRGKKILYENEENFFYVLYQSWDGDKANSIMIEKIRKAAERDLINYKDAIKLYWQQYPEEKNDFDQDLISSINKNSGIYMPLKTLIFLTKKAKIKDKTIKNKLKIWEKILRTNETEISKIENDNNTLYSFLKRERYV